MPQTLGNHDRFKMLLSGAILAFALYIYFDFLMELGDIYPDMIWDEVASGLLGVGFVVIWYRFLAKR